MSMTNYLSKESPITLGIIMKPIGYNPSDWPDPNTNYPRQWSELSEAEQEAAVSQIKKRSITGTLADVTKNLVSMFGPKATVPGVPGLPTDNKIFGLDPKIAIGIGAAGLVGLVLIMKK